MKRVLSWFLAMILLLAVIPEGVIPVSAEQSGDYVYDVSGPNTVMITRYKGAGGDVVIPDKLDGYTVTEITDGAFHLCTAMTSVTIPESVTVIGFNAFSQCSGLVSITIPDSVTVIETAAFFQCTGLKSVQIGCGVKTIGNTAFAYCTGLTGVTIPNSVTTIETSAFSHCEAMTEAVIPDSVTAIGVSAFEHCERLTGVVLPKGIAEISNGVFEACYELISVVIPQGVERIGDSAFKRCEALTGVNIPNSVTTIGSQAFENCIGLTSISIPDSVTTIGDSAFAGCTGITDVILSNSLAVLREFTFERCISLTDIIIPGSVTLIRELVFSECSALTKAYFFGNAPVMGSEVFGYCAESFMIYYIEGNATFPNPWLDYETAAFIPLATPSFTAAPEVPTNGSVSVEITYPENAVTKEYRQGTGGWTAYSAPVTVPDNTTVYARCGDAAFNISAVGSIVINNIDKTAPAAPALGALPVLPTGGDVTVTVVYPADAAVKEYRLAEGGSWQPYTAPVVLSANNTVFARCADSAGNISGESSVSVNNIIHVEDFTFDIVGNSAVITGYTGAGGAVTIPDRLGGYPVTVIGFDAFINCDELRSVIIPQGVTIIEDSAFSLCGNLAGVLIPDSVTEIEDSAFSNCTALADIIVPNSVTTIGMGAFQDCSGLTDVVLPAGINCVKNQTFSGCAALRSVVIPDSVTVIEDFAFFGCAALAEITLSAGIAEIGDGAFRGCSQLTGAYFFSDAPQPGDDVFGSCAPAFTVFYAEGKDGFESPWHGYTTAVFIPLATPLFSATPATPTRGKVTVTVTFPQSATVKEYKLGNGAWTAYSDPILLSDNNTFFAKCSDAAGNISRTGSKTVSNIDKTPPSTPAIQISPDVPTITSVTVTITYPADAATREYRIGTGNWLTYNIPVFPVANGTVYARCADAAGNISQIASRVIDNVVALIAKPGSTTVVDYGNSYIYGLIPGISSLWNHVKIPSGEVYDLVCVPTPNGFGTGTVANVILQFDIIESYQIIIFGDVNGDGNIDTGDAGMIVDYENFIILWDPVADAALLKAADVNGDGNVDTGDAGIIIDHENFILSISQVTGLPG